MIFFCREFGIKVVNVKPLLKRIPALLEDRDKSVREEGKSMVIEIFRWIGPALKPQLSALKPVQVSESLLVYTYFTRVL